MMIVENLDYKTQNGDTLLRGISFSLQAGTLLPVFGPSGSGKSVLLRILAGLADPTSGTITVGEKNRKQMTPLDIQRLIGYHPQYPVLFERTVLENLQMFFKHPAYRHLARPEYETLVEKLAKLELPAELLERTSHELSFGEAQRLALLRVFLLEPKIVLLDEPTSHLDKHTAKLVEQYIGRQVRRHQIGLIVATHDQSRIQDLWDNFSPKEVLHLNRKSAKDPDILQLNLPLAIN